MPAPASFSFFHRIQSIPMWVWALGLVILPMLLQIIASWNAFPPVPGTVFGMQEPDSWLRLTLVRDWLSGGSWYDHTVMHSNAPYGGTTSPWTRPLDLVIAFFVGLQPPSWDLNMRLAHAALLLPPVWISLLLTALFRIARDILPLRNVLLFISLLIGSAVPLWGYFGTGNADHHGLLAALFFWALALVLSSKATLRQVALAGVLLGIQLWVSPEALILIGIVYGWLGFCWLRGVSHAGMHWSVLAVSVALTTALAVLIERPVALWLVPIYDSISILYVMLVSFAAIVILLLSALRFSSVRARAMAATFLFSGAGLLALCLFPDLAHGPMAQVDPYVHSHFLNHIQEAESPFKAPWLFAIALFLQPIFAMGILLVTLRVKHSVFTQERVKMLLYFVVTVGALYFIQQRFNYYFYPLVTLVIALFLGSLFSPSHACVSYTWPARWIKRYPEPQQAMMRILLMMVLILVPFACVALHVISSAKDPFTQCTNHSLKIIQDGRLVEALGDKPLTIFAHTDSGSHLLFFTPYRIIASNYHREGDGIRYIWEADKIRDANALHRYFAMRKVDALLYCPSPVTDKKGVLYDLFKDGKAPSWLHFVPVEKVPHVTAEEKELTPLLYRISY